MKTIEQLSERTLKQKLRELQALPELNPAMLDMRTRIEKRLLAIKEGRQAGESRNSFACECQHPMTLHTPDHCWYCGGSVHNT